MPITKDPIHGFFTSREVRKTNEEGKLVTSTFYKCMFCDKEMVFSAVGRLRQHLSGDKTLTTGSGGWGPCPNVPVGIAVQHKKLVMDAVQVSCVK